MMQGHSKYLAVVFLGAEILYGFLSAGSAIAQLVQHGAYHAVVELLVFFICPVGQCSD
jgi:hypothetical protein